MNTKSFPALSGATLLAVNTVGQWLAQNDFPANSPVRRIVSSWRAMR
ncbi:inner membrane protein [Salmonella enterica subsp. arizonae]|nr:inner membrane protein [Salmonella enterica subsp. arizonae]